MGMTDSPDAGGKILRSDFKGSGYEWRSQMPVLSAFSLCLLIWMINECQVDVRLDSGLLDLILDILCVAVSTKVSKKIVQKS